MNKLDNKSVIYRLVFICPIILVLSLAVGDQIAERIGIKSPFESRITSMVMFFMLGYAIFCLFAYIHIKNNKPKDGG